MRDSVWSAVQTPPPMYRGLDGGGRGGRGQRERERERCVRWLGNGAEGGGIGRGVGETGWNG